ncbi:Com family DNA-binding transcriptional regulator [Candidatus Margulisiibacteriota bacterium]
MEGTKPESAQKEALKEFRCKFCKRLLAKVGEAKRIEIKCPKCKTMNLFTDDEIFIIQIDEAYIGRQIAKGKVNYSNNLVRN